MAPPCATTRPAPTPSTRRRPADDPGMHVHAHLRPGAEPRRALHRHLARPQIAILREQGVNSHVEMAYALAEAGFDAFVRRAHDDLQSGAVVLDFKGLRGPAAASAMATPWAPARAGPAPSCSTRCWPRAVPGLLRASDTFGLGVCNGCQMLAALAPTSSPGADAWPRFTKRNQSEQFEARLSLVEVLESPSLFFTGMAGSRLPIAVAHGEGFANFARQGDAEPRIKAMRFVDNSGQPPSSPIRSTRTAARWPHVRHHAGWPLHGLDAAPRARVRASSRS